MKVRTAVITFAFNEPVKARADRLRGFFASHFGEYTFVHQHLDNNRVLYRAPLIQYKVVNETPLVLGIGEGAETLRRIYEELNYIRIGPAEYKIAYKRLFLNEDTFGVTERLLPYTFLTPWLALNEGNYQKYICAGNWPTRKQLLERILIGNILSVSKSIGYTVSEPIQLEIEEMRETKAKLKGTPMLGFLGTFRVNFEIPEYFGLGKSVSRGFGTVGRLES